MLRHVRSQGQNKSRPEGGFTLVELLVVIVILGILAAVVVFAVGGTEDDARVKACLTERSAVEAAVEAYHSQTDGEEPSMAVLLSGTGDVERLLKHTPQYWDVAGGSLSRINTGKVPVDKCQV